MKPCPAKTMKPESSYSQDLPCQRNAEVDKEPAVYP